MRARQRTKQLGTEKTRMGVVENDMVGRTRPPYKKCAEDLNGVTPRVGNGQPHLPLANAVIGGPEGNAVSGR